MYTHSQLETMLLNVHSLPNEIRLSVSEAAKPTTNLHFRVCIDRLYGHPLFFLLGLGLQSSVGDGHLAQPGVPVQHKAVQHTQVEA